MTISFQSKENKEPKAEKLIKKEFSVKSFKRTFSLDEKINIEAIDAVMEHGILTLSLPLKESSNAPKTVISIK